MDGASQSATGDERATARPVFIISLITAICLLGDSALYVLLPSRLEVFSVSPTGAGLILGVNRYIRAFSNTGAGWVVERTGLHWPLAFAIFLAAGTTLGYGLFTGFWALFIAHGLWGISWSFLRLGGYLAVIESAGGAAVGRFMGLLQGISRGGSLVAVGVGGILADTIGGQDTFVVFGVVTLAAFILLPFGRIPHHLGRRVVLAQAAPKAAPTSTTPLSDQENLRRLRTLYALAVIVWFLIPGVFMSSAGYLVSTVAGDGATFAGLLIGIGALSGILVGVRWAGDIGLGPVFGHLSDRLGRSKVELTSMTAAASAMLIVAISPTLPVAMLMFSVIFIASTAIIVSLNASAAELAPADRRAMVLSRYSTWADIGSGTGATVGLPLVTTAGFGWTYVGAAVLMALAGLLYWAVFVRMRN
jgi:MFS family permease